MIQNGFSLHGAIAYSTGRKELVTLDDAYVVCVDGKCAGVFEKLPEEYAELPVEDHWDQVIMPGLVDLHVHAPQYQYRALGMDLELIDWLNANAFPEEAKYSDLEYAERAYDLFVEDLYVGATTRASIFATADANATLGLMDMLEETGLVTYVGKVNMDRNVPDYYVETTEESEMMTRAWLSASEGQYSHTKPILTPRFTPACSRELLLALAKLGREFDVPVQSHISENLGEIEWVKELEPDTAFYGESYDKAGLFGSPEAAAKTGTGPAGDGGCIMAHAVWSTDEELALMKRNGVFIAHCPESNMNIRSGVAPVSRYLDMGLRVGLGSDVAGGSTTNLFAAMRNAVTSSKLRWRLYDQSVAPLTFPEVFYLATLGGGAFFGKVGTFLPGYEFDAVVVDDESFPTMRELTTRERCERIMYLADDRNVVGKYVQGRKLF